MAENKAKKKNPLDGWMEQVEEYEKGTPRRTQVDDEPCDCH